MRFCSICRKNIDVDVFSSLSFEGKKTPACGYCYHLINGFDKAPDTKKDKIKKYLRRQIEQGNVTEESFPVIEHCFSDDAQGLIALAKSNMKPVVDKSKGSYNGTINILGMLMGVCALVGGAFFVVKGSYVWAGVLMAVSTLSFVLSAFERDKKKAG